MREEKKFITKIGSRIITVLGQWSVVAFGYTLAINFIHHEVMEKIVGAVAIVAGLCILIYNIIDLITLYLKNRRYRTYYERKFIDKVTISYAVGSFWEVVDKFHKDESVAVILGVNNEFNLDLSFINPKSLIGNYMTELTEENRLKVTENIENYIGKHLEGLDHDGYTTYPYGELVHIPSNNQHFYDVGLLSMCERSPSKIPGKFTVKQDDLVIAMEKMFEKMSHYYTDATLIVPLIGTKSSTSPLSRKDVAKYLISSFAHHTRVNHSKLANRIVISIYHKDDDFQTIDDILDVKRHIDSECDMGDFSYAKLRPNL